MQRAKRVWMCRGVAVPLNRPLVMGIVNATPDSFFSASRTPDPADAARRALALIEEGADILDIGAESTRPGSVALTPQEEIDRLCPVIAALVEAGVSVPISVDTRHAGTAAAALEAGAHIINDVQGVEPDAGMWRLVADSGAGYVLMHTRGSPQTMGALTDYPEGGVVASVKNALETARAALIAEGCLPEQIMLDPGLGFAKTHADSLRLLASVPVFDAIAPVLIGASRKRFIGAFTGQEEAAGRLAGSLGAALRAAAGGAAVVRVHDVRATCDALRIFTCAALTPEVAPC